MDFLTPDKNVCSCDLRANVKNTSTIPPGYVPPLIRGLSLEDSVKSTSWSTSKHKPHSLYLGINQGYNDTVSSCTNTYLLVYLICYSSSK